MKNDYEKLSAEWSPKNEKPFDAYTPGSHYKALWICSAGHEWPAMIKSRFEGNGCPYCSGRLPIKGKTDLESQDPILSEDWNYEKNGDLKPSDVTVMSNKKVWWRCKNGHEWETAVCRRKAGNGCPYCGHRIVAPETSLAALCPDIAAEFDLENNAFGPWDVTAHSNRYVNWACEKGHHWTATVNSRTRKNRPCKCPFCTERRVVPGVNDLETKAGHLLIEWDYKKNRVKPSEVACSSNTKVWWVCIKGHSWKAKIANRYNGRGCPYCVGKKGI